MENDKQDTKSPDVMAITALLYRWADAVHRHDLPAILAHHATDMIMFDLPPPLQCQGLETYAETWEPFFENHQLGGAFDIRELSVTAGVDVAFAAAIMWCGPVLQTAPENELGFAFRLTIGLRKQQNVWLILHEHHSVPSLD